MNETQVKQKKVKGPIRFEYIVPFLIIVGLITLYFVVFFDGHLRRAIEFGATYANGAEVNVEDVSTSFIKGQFTLTNMQVTSAEQPTKNIVQIGRMNFQFLWDALLRAKFVIQDASIDQLQVNTPRTRPGTVTKKDDPEVAEEKKEGEGSALADAGNLLGGSIDLKGLQNVDNLQSAAKIKDLQTQLSSKEKEWSTAVTSMPTGQELQSLQNRISSVKIGGTNNPAEIQAQIKNVESLINEANDKVNKVRTTGDTLKGSVSKFQDSIKSLESDIQQDIKGLESKLKLPKLDVESLSKQFFGDAFFAKFSKAKRYMLLARKYLPPKKTEEEKLEDKLEARKRSEGQTFQFPITTGYPLFWLKRAALSSKAANSPFGGDIKGEILDVCSKPSQIGRPTIIQFAGNFPTQQIQGVEAKITLDHTGDVPVQRLKASVGSYPVAEQMLSQTNDLKFGFQKAVGSASIEGAVQGDQITFSAKNRFSNIDYVVAAQSGELNSLLTGAVQDIKQVNVDATAKGTLTDMKFDIVSNIAAELQKGFEKQLKAKVDEAKAQIQKLIDEKIGSQKRALTDQYAGLQSKYTSQVAEKQKEADKIKGQADAKMNEAKNQASNQGQKAIDDIKKNLPIKF
jgi:uncharacterized protein (TIGR03545 family)